IGSQCTKNIGTEITASRGASKQHSNRIRNPFASSTPSTHSQPTLPSSRYLILESFGTGEGIKTKRTWVEPKKNVRDERRWSER
ncbi:hypothetical protein K0M31_020340, partial [Melipona bicolor]